MNTPARREQDLEALREEIAQAGRQVSSRVNRLLRLSWGSGVLVALLGLLPLLDRVVAMPAWCGLPAVVLAVSILLVLAVAGLGIFPGLLFARSRIQEKFRRRLSFLSPAERAQVWCRSSMRMSTRS